MHSWFEPFVVEWLFLSRANCKEMILRSFDLDSWEPINEESGELFSTSVIDCYRILFDILSFWAEIDWPGAVRAQTDTKASQALADAHRLTDARRRSQTHRLTDSRVQILFLYTPPLNVLSTDAEAAEEHLFTHLAESICFCVRFYASEMTSRVMKQAAPAEGSDKLCYTIPGIVFTGMNNLAFANEKLQEVYECMEVEKVQRSHMERAQKANKNHGGRTSSCMSVYVHGHMTCLHCVIR